MGKIIKMQKRYRFRKMYFHCNDKKVISEEHQFTNAYRTEEYAKATLDTRDFRFIHEDQSKPMPVQTVEAFYLVPEALYDEILKKYTED